MPTSTLADQISSAIGAHGLWKSRLRAAVDSGKSDTAPKAVQDDHACNFGKWLYGSELSAADKASAHYKECADLHRRFHQAAANVTSLALAGKKQEAHQALDDSHDFAKISRDLTRALVAWKDA